MKKIAVFLLLSSFFTTQVVLAQGSSLKGINPLDYNSEQAALFNQLSVSEQDELLKSASKNAPEGIVGCFDYYHFGSVQVSLNGKMSPVVPGTPVAFTGTIKNDNTYPALDLSVYIKIFRVQGNESEQRLNGDFLVDQFFATPDSVALAGKSTRSIEFIWMSPKNLVPGEYRVATYVVSAQQFNLSGLSFTDDVTGNSLAFTVGGEAKSISVEWDKNKVQINSKDYFFAKPIPKLEENETAVITVPVINFSNTKKEAVITWTTFSWDALRLENKIAETSQTISLEPNETKGVEFTVPKHEKPVSYVVGKLESDGGRSIIDVRFANAGKTQARLNFPALTRFPIAAGESVDMFSCFHSVAPEGILEGELTLSLVDENNREITSTSYKGRVTGEMMGFKKDFIAPSNINKATLVATLAYNNELQTVSMNYDCAELGEGVCLQGNTMAPIQSGETGANNFSLRTFLLFGLPLLILVIIILILVMKRKTSAVPPVATLLVFLLAALYGSSPLQVLAGQATWTNSTPINVGFITTYGGTSNSVNTLSNLLIDVRYISNASKADNALVQTGDVITIDTPTSGTDIDWFAATSFTDSPYGKWGNTFDQGCLTYSNFLDYAGQYTVHYGQALVTRPTPTISATGMTCSGSGPFTCTVTSGSGAISATVTFPSTSGRFRFEVFETGVTEQPAPPVGFINKPGYYFSLLKNLLNPTIPVAFAGIAQPQDNTCIVQSPVPFTVDQRSIVHNFTVDNNAFQPNLRAGSVIPNTATTDQLTTFSAIVTNAGGVATAGSFPNIIKVASGANGSGSVVKLAATTQNSAVPAGDTIGIVTSHTFTSAGFYSMQACADEGPVSGGTQTESNEGDNCGAWTNITVTSPSIDVHF